MIFLDGGALASIAWGPCGRCVGPLWALRWAFAAVIGGACGRCDPVDVVPGLCLLCVGSLGVLRGLRRALSVRGAGSSWALGPGHSLDGPFLKPPLPEIAASTQIRLLPLEVLVSYAVGTLHWGDRDALGDENRLINSNENFFFEYPIRSGHTSVYHKSD